MSADPDAIELGMPRIRQIIMTASARDTCKADELYPFYCHPPVWTPSNEAVSGYKKENTSIKLLACCNADGSGNIPLMVIGSALNHRPFKKNQRRTLDLISTPTKGHG